MCAPQTPAQGPQSAPHRVANEISEEAEEEPASLDDSLDQRSWKDEATVWSSLPAALDLDSANQVCPPARVDWISELDLQ